MSANCQLPVPLINLSNNKKQFLPEIENDFIAQLFQKPDLQWMHLKFLGKIKSY